MIYSTVLALALALACGTSAASAAGTADFRTPKYEGSWNATSLRQYQVEMAWLGNTNWIVKFFNAQGERRNILLDTAVGTQLDRIMETVGATTIDYIILGHTHFDHDLDAKEIAERFGAQVFAGMPLCDNIDPQLATCTRAEPGKRVITNDGLVIEMTPTPHSPTGVGRDPDPYSYRITFPALGASIFYSDTFRPFMEDDDSEYAGRYLDELARNVDGRGVNAWFVFATPMTDVKYFDEVNDIIRARNYMPQHLPLGDFFPQLDGDFAGYEPQPWELTDLDTPQRPTRLLRMGNYFTTVVLQGDETSIVNTPYHEIFKTLSP